MRPEADHFAGDPRQLPPVLQSQARGDQTLTLIALERWDPALITTVELELAPIGALGCSSGCVSSHWA